MTTIPPFLDVLPAFPPIIGSRDLRPLQVVDSVKQGSLITLSGLDGSGKSSCVAWAVDELTRSGRIAYQAKYSTSGSVQLSKALDQLVHAGSASEDEIAQFIAVDLIGYIATEIQPRLNDGVDVVCDRYVWDFLLTARVAFGISGARAHVVLCAAPMPVLPLLIQCDPETCMGRIESRAREETKLETAEILTRKAFGYQFLRKALPFRVIDGSSSLSRVEHMVRAEIRGLLSAII